MALLGVSMPYIRKEKIMVPNKNNKKETWIKKRHKFIVPVGMKFIGMYAKWKYNIDAKPYKDQGK